MHQSYLLLKKNCISYHGPTHFLLSLYFTYFQRKEDLVSSTLKGPRGYLYGQTYIFYEPCQVLKTCFLHIFGFCALLCTLSYGKEKNKSTLTCDISNHNIKCVFASKGTQYVYFNPNSSDNIKVSSRFGKNALNRDINFQT